MSDYGLLVIGSGPAGVGAAQAYVQAGGRGPVAIVTADIDAPYMRPPLSKEVLAGSSPAERTPIDGDLPDEVEVRLGASVTSVDLDARTVTAGGDTLSFDRLVLGTGAKNVPLPGVDADAETFSLRSLDDARRLVTAAEHARTAVVVGSGFIGCEAAASLARRGVEVTLVTSEAGPQVTRLGEFAGARITEWLVTLGVQVRTGVHVTGIAAPRTVHLDDGTTLAPDLVLVAVGVAPAAGDLLASTGLQLHQGRVVADEYLGAAPGVWVAGDAARALNAAAGRPIPVEHWGDAEAMGALAGSNAAAADGNQVAWDGVPGFWSEIGEHVLQYWAWGDGHEREEVVARTGGFTIWYADADDVVVGVLTYRADDDYERGIGLIAAAATLTEALAGRRVDEEDDEAQG
ncbi:NAD(P)/FAD-dependent oxidoreductase [Agilicoccus flavus]|uniref:NAD(P)/FAD-dependent oxidoreductase n=1 Tax=Agilicoccus flavus TaxID=2775968 RepID=UPI001CF68320|nr:NAD(P)/FAD-dependent oxidoreductase [Agilicoccus flavus]